MTIMLYVITEHKDMCVYVCIYGKGDERNVRQSVKTVLALFFFRLQTDAIVGNQVSGSRNLVWYPRRCGRGEGLDPV